MLTKNPQTNRLREQLRSLQFTKGQVKTADLGGGTDSNFEQAFASLANAYIKDKAPKLLDFIVGFQLIEKNQENTKAVGCFGAKVGHQWLFMPIFFLSGDIKGHELLYIKNQDIFVPLSEEWIGYLLGQKPSVLGEGVTRNLSQMGIMPPNLYQMSRSPYKFASHTPPPIAGWTKQSNLLPTLAHWALTTPQPLTDLPTFLKEAGRPTFNYLLKIGSMYPDLLAAVDHFYGPDMLTEVARDIHASERPGVLKQAVVSATGEHPPGWNGGVVDSTTDNGGLFSSGPTAWHSTGDYKRSKSQPASFDKLKKHKGSVMGCGTCSKTAGSVKHTTLDKAMAKGRPDVMHDLSEGEKKKLLKERVVIRDTRDEKEVTHAYNVQLPLTLRNPDETGIYEVLVRPDKFEKCLIIIGPYSKHGRESFATVVRLEGDKNWLNTHPANLWIRSVSDRETYTKWLQGLPEKDLPESGSYRRKFVLIGPTGEGTVPFSVRESYEGGQGGSNESYDVWFDDCAHGDRPAYLPEHRQRDPYSYGDTSGGGSHRAKFQLMGFYREGTMPYGTSCHEERLVCSELPGIKLRVDRGSVTVPANFKCLQVEGPKKEDDNDDYDPGSRSEPSPIEPGNLRDIQIMLISTTTPMKINSDGKDVSVNEGRRMDKISALLHLVYDHGLREKTALALIAEADKRGLFECRVKYAANPLGAAADMITGAPNAPPFREPYVGYDPMTGGNVPTMQMSEFNTPIPDMSASKTDRNIYNPLNPDPRAMQVAQQAAQTGQREVFDTAMLGSLLKSVSQESMVDRYLGDLLKGLDRLGRILFLFYWHGEEFEDRYGKQDMPELEDGIRNTFEGMGDIVLKLKRKTIEPYPDEGANIDLSDVANS